MRPLPPGRQAGAGAGTAGGLGWNLAAAGVTAATGMAAERLWRGRRTAVALDSGRPEQDRSYVETPDVEMVVVASDGVPLHVEIDEARSPSAGQPGRPTVVFSHGYCMSLQSWVFQRRALREAGYRVVLWDQRGHGRSGVGDRDSYDIDQLGEDLSMVIRTAVGDGPVVLVGHSMGGMTMMAMALVDEEQVTAQVVGAAFLATTTGRIAEVSFGLARPIGQLIHWVAPAAALTLASRQHLVDGTVRAGREIVDFFVDWGSFGSPVPLSIAQLTTDMIVGTRMDTISAFMPRFSAHDKREALAAYRGTEALVLNGTRDKLCPPDHSAEIVRQLPGAEHVVVQEAGHIIMLEHPQLVNEQLMALVQRSHRHPAEAGSYDLDALVSGAGRSAQGPVGRHEEAATRRALHRRSRRGLRTRPREQEPPS